MRRKVDATKLDRLHPWSATVMIRPPDFVQCIHSISTVLPVLFSKLLIYKNLKVIALSSGGLLLAPVSE